ncbi:MAG: hypothetical protein IPG31_02965 [Nitrosomonas sp.]|nr:hypothetical protein [Nitrosomonas sp.]
MPNLQEFITCHNSFNRHQRKETWNEQSNLEGRWRKYSFDQIMVRDKTSLDISWLKDKSLADLDNLPEPDELALEIIDNLGAGLNSSRNVAAVLSIGSHSACRAIDCPDDHFDSHSSRVACMLNFPICER